jgi:hypothetical protein
VDGAILLTGQEKANAIAAVFANAHNNTMHSSLNAIVEDNCSALLNTESNNNVSSLGWIPKKVLGQMESLQEF